MFDAVLWSVGKTLEMFWNLVSSLLPVLSVTCYECWEKFSY